MLGTALITSSRGVLALAEQSLHRVKAFSAPHTTRSESRLEVHKRLRRDTAKTTDPSAG